MENFIFIMLFLLVFGGAMLVALARQIVTSLFGLLLTLASLAGLYIFLSADFVAVAQVLIYIGGVIILLLFALMLTGRTANEMTVTNPAMRRIPAFLFVAVFFALSLYVIFSLPMPTPDEQILQQAAEVSKYEAGTRKIGHLLLTDFILPFEYISFLIVVLLVGSTVLIRKELLHLQHNPKEPEKNEAFATRVSVTHASANPTSASKEDSHAFGE